MLGFDLEVESIIGMGWSLLLGWSGDVRILPRSGVYYWDGVEILGLDLEVEIYYWDGVEMLGFDLEVESIIGMGWRC